MATRSNNNPLLDETDGVLQNGSVINSAPTADTLNNSCWTQPDKQLHSPEDPEYEAGTCQVCVIQSGVGPVAWYEAWVRDPDIMAAGNLPAVLLGLGTKAGGDLGLWRCGEGFDGYGYAGSEVWGRGPVCGDDVGGGCGYAVDGFRSGDGEGWYELYFSE